MRSFLSGLLLLCFVHTVFSQSVPDAAVQITAQVQDNPPQITLNWIGNNTTNQYQVHRKLKSASSWGAAIAFLNGITNQYTDNTVTTGTNYEYRVMRMGQGYTGYGYINCGIKIPETEYRGKLILIVDSTLIVPLANEISRLVNDISSDGWDVIRHDVLRAGSVTHVKSVIRSYYNADSVNTRSVFLLGHVPVPYSGNLAPDAHPDHQGAWPADVFYADMDGVWTDITVTSTNASPARTQNVPGDGKYDQSLIPGEAELELGRVDLWGMNSFSLTEVQLLKNYLDKDHDYRKKNFTVNRQGVVDDNFGFTSETFAGSGYRNLAPLTGNPVQTADYFTSLASGSYLWSYGCGGGSYTSAQGIGNTGNFAQANHQGVFTMLFGSYFGDWDVPNNFLRAPLCQGRTLTNAWAGRPHWQFHHMAMGEPIGYSTRLSQNNTGLYFASPYPLNVGITHGVHIALMGDPTLRNSVVAPASNIIATKSGFNCNISWSASTETNVLGYHLYMKNDTNTSFVRINPTLISGTTYTDLCLQHKGVYTYMVKALILEDNGSGSFYNLSEGIADTAFNNSDLATMATFSMALTGNSLSCLPSSSLATSYLWDFGDGQTSTDFNPSHAFVSNGSYTVTLIAGNDCGNDTAVQIINITEVGLSDHGTAALRISPNPSSGFIKLTGGNGDCYVMVYSREGRLVFEKAAHNGELIDLSGLAKGVYILHVKTHTSALREKLLIH